WALAAPVAASAGAFGWRAGTVVPPAGGQRNHARRRGDPRQPARPLGAAARCRAHRPSGLAGEHGHGGARMIGRGTLFWLALAILAGVGLSQAPSRVQSLEEELPRVNRQILQERDTIHLLRAEWSYLNEPTRLAELAQRHLTLAPLAATQMVDVEDLPLRLPPLVAETQPLPVAHAPSAGNDHAAAESHPPSPPPNLTA